MSRVTTRSSRQPGPLLTRRSFLRAALAGAAAAGVAGCSSDNPLSGLTVSRATGSLQYWDLFGGGDGVRMKEMVAAFREEHPEVDFEQVTLEWGNPYYTKLSLATIGDKPPAVAVSHLTRMKTLVSSDLLQELKPDDLSRFGMTPDKFNQRAWEAGLVDGKAYAVPLDTHPFVMFYNTDVVKEAGLLDADGTLKPLDSEEAFLDAMRRAKEVTGAYGGVIAIDNDTSTSWRVFQSLYSQLGGEVLADDGRRVVIDDDKALQVLSFLETWTKDGLFPASVDYEGSIALFPNGQAGFFFQGEWEISTFQTAKMPFDMTLFPNIYGGDRYSVQADSHTLVLPVQPTQDQEQLDQSLLFIRSLLDQSPTWTAGGHVPTWLPFANSDEYKNLKPQSNYASAADAAVYDPPGWYSGSGSNFEIATGSAIGTVMSGQQSPQAALDQMHADLENLAGTASPI
jgi:multiple sugar transport system substrate-binding protein